MNKLPANTGWQWIKQAFSLFRKQPFALTALMLSCLFLSVAFLLIPLFGPILPVLTIPLFSAALLQACADIDQGKPVHSGLLFVAFKRQTLWPLAALGSLYLLVTLLAFGVMCWMDDGRLLKMALNETPFDIALLEESKYAVQTATTIMQLAWLFSCFATPLIYWQKMSLGKALFFSFFSVARALKAFATSVIIFFVVSQFAGLLAAIVFGTTQAIILILPITLLSMVLIHCWLYVSYRQIFGAVPEQEAAQAK
ncbi:BPSS1780 family membrane protein [Rugamonas sp.]|uniref:BPSS1780 family membrane protein n=1 Tax=Rugamonas sp. TaxID=1926287 RepID=UPI0025FED10E|nr:BPSS1780 family membrane protein [Rugamonas sp.]